jgi:zinc transport system permease protein
MIELLQEPYILNALLASILASIACGITGTYIVSRKQVFMSGGISHASFGGIGISYYLGLEPFFGALAFTVASASGVQFLSKSKVLTSDTLIGIMWSFGMAIGILFIHLSPGYTPNLMTYLFGNILTVSPRELYLGFGMTLLVVFFFLFWFRQILNIAHDEDFARTLYRRVDLMNFILTISVALTIVVSIRVAGIILVISLLSIPPAIARLFNLDFRQMIFFSILASVLASFAGLYLSFRWDFPSGATIILSLTVLFVLAWLWKKWQSRMKRNQHGSTAGITA